MTLVPIASYLKTYRKRMGLTHEEVAFLVGAMNSTSFSHHERALRVPMLRTALMYEFIFGVAIREVYPILFFKAQADVCQRVRGLCKSLERKPRTTQRDYKIALLKRLLEQEVRELMSTGR